MACKTDPSWPIIEIENPQVFIFRNFPAEKTEKKGLFPQFRATENSKTENWELDGFLFSAIGQ